MFVEVATTAKTYKTSEGFAERFRTLWMFKENAEKQVARHTEAKNQELTAWWVAQHARFEDRIMDAKLEEVQKHVAVSEVADTNFMFAGRLVQIFTYKDAY